MSTPLEHDTQSDLTGDGLNVGRGERIASIAGGSALILLGLARRSRGGLALAGAGAAMVYRGVGGRCLLYRALGVNRAAGETTEGNLGVKVDRSLLIGEPAHKLYTFWRNLGNLPSIMPHVHSVKVLSPTTSHWAVKGPLGTTLEWDAEIITDRPNELIAWRTKPGAWVEHAGSVRFEPQPDGGTLVSVSLQYDPPGGELAHMVGSLFGEDPGRRIDEDLARLRDSMARAHEDRDGLQPASADALGYPR